MEIRKDNYSKLLNIYRNLQDKLARKHIYQCSICSEVVDLKVESHNVDCLITKR